MFTGLVQAVGRVVSVTPSGSPGIGHELGGAGLGSRIEIDPGAWDHAPRVGDSICVSGCCLTIAQAPAEDGHFIFDAVRETLSRTTLGSLRPGTGVNLEHAVRADTLMGGHFVQGHVEGLGRVTRVTRTPGDWRVEIEPAGDLMDATIPKGSIAVEGVSLTVARVEGNRFEIALIPTTLAATTLAQLREGDSVNIETDMLARAAVHALRRLRPTH